MAFSYNPLKQLKEIRDWLGSTRIELDALGRPFSITDYRGNTVRYEWGTMGERTKLVYPDGRETLYGYDEYGTLSRILDATGEYGYICSHIGQVPNILKKHLPNGMESEYDYNEIGRMESLSGNMNTMDSVTVSVRGNIQEAMYWKPFTVITRTISLSARQMA